MSTFKLRLQHLFLAVCRRVNSYTSLAKNFQEFIESYDSGRIQVGF